MLHSGQKKTGDNPKIVDKTRKGIVVKPSSYKNVRETKNPQQADSQYVP